jgi:hypothetical protein
VEIPKDVCAAAAATSETAIFAELPCWRAAPKYQGGIGAGGGGCWRCHPASIQREGPNKGRWNWTFRAGRSGNQAP